MCCGRDKDDYDVDWDEDWDEDWDGRHEREPNPEDDEESTLDSEELYDRNCPMGMMECPTTGDCIENEQRSATQRYKSNPLLLYCY